MKGLKATSLKFKLVFYFTILILAYSLILGFITVQRVSATVTHEAEDSLALLAQDAAKLTESRIETQQKTLDMIAVRTDIQTMDWEIQLPIIQRQVERTNFLDIGVVDLNGNAKYSDGSEAQLGDREYIKRALAGEANVSDLIVSRVTNEIVLMYAVPIENDGEVMGALIGRRDGYSLSMIADDTGFGKTGYGYMINKDGIMVAHPDRDKVFNQFNPIEESKNDASLTSVANLFSTILAEKSGVSNYSFEGNDLYASYFPIEGSDWFFIITANEGEVLDSIPELQKMIIKASLIVLAISIAFVYVIGSSIANPVILAVQHVKKIAALDLTQDVPAKFMKRKDEVGDLANALQIIVDNLKEIITEITNASAQVLVASEELSSASQQSASAATEISQTIEEVAKGAFDQAENTQEGSINANELGRVIEDNQLYIENLNAQSDKVSQVVDEGLIEIEGLYNITKENNQATHEVKDVIIQTNDSSIKIGQASNVISSIAEQTNLLALNAAIEAARAGNTGKGFAVVAEEIKSLALQSSQSTKEIDEIVNELQLNAQNAVQKMERGLAITEEQTKSVIRNKDKYLLINTAMKETKETVNQLNISGDQMYNSKDQILASMESLSAIAEENSAATEQASASIQEQAASAEEISATSEGLTTLAKGLQSIIQRFEI